MYNPTHPHIFYCIFDCSPECPCVLCCLALFFSPGNSYYAEEVERQIAEFHVGNSALLFNSGYVANLSLLSSLPQPGHIVLHDLLVHNSIKEGLRLSRARMKVSV